MRCLVAGAAGFIGSHLVERLCADGHEVVGVDNFITGQRRNLEELGTYDNFTFIEQDIIEDLAVDGSIDVVYSLACPASPVDFKPLALHILRVCSAGVLNLLELARHKEAALVHASTSECYGDPLEHPQKESYRGNVNPVGERAPYDEGKRYAEALVITYHRLYGLQTTIGRVFNTYGPRMRLGDGRVLPNFIQQALEGRPLTVYGEGKQTRSFCYVTDLVDGLVRLSACRDPLPINLGNAVEMSIIDLAREVIAATASDSSIGFRPLPSDDPKLRQPDISRAREILGWEPATGRAEGLNRTIEYFRTILAEVGPTPTGT